MLTGGGLELARLLERPRNTYDAIGDQWGEIIPFITERRCSGSNGGKYVDKGRCCAPSLQIAFTAFNPKLQSFDQPYNTWDT